MNNVKAIIGNEKTSNLLGQSVLSLFGKVTINYNRSELILE